MIPRLLKPHLIDRLASPKVMLLLGARQVGKTTLIREVFAGRETIYLNLDIEYDRQRLIASGQLPPEQGIAYLGDGESLIIDEAQRLPECARIVKGWYDNGSKLKCALLGSAGLDILDKTAEPLTGRNEKFYLMPLLLEELVTDQPWYHPALSRQQFAQPFELLLDKFLIEGGYPEVATAAHSVEVLTTLYQDYLFKDVFGLELVSSRAKLQKLLSLLAWQVGSEVSVNEIATQLGMSRDTVERYLGILEDTFILFRLPAWSRNPRKELSKKQKIYFWDNGIRNAVINDFSAFARRSDRGALWENFIVSEFAKRNLMLTRREKLYFWRNYAGSEVDLVIQQDQELLPLEIKLSATKTKSRSAFAKEYGSEPKILNRENFWAYLVRA